MVSFSMPKGKTLQVVFKQDHQYQGSLLPLDLNDLIAADHPVRTINAVLEKVDIKAVSLDIVFVL